MNSSPDYTFLDFAMISNTGNEYTVRSQCMTTYIIEVYIKVTTIPISNLNESKLNTFLKVVFTIK